ncbi:MAG: two-component system, OmpR family, sensor kinase, partial [Solirubrobacteraceae bacterium]|nr:two-component system, OmpR family, sensor kinase [Solirubrobacteraceae bacterium]
MKFRTRLLGTALATLAVGLGALIIIGNVLLGHRIDQEATNLLEARVQAEVAALTITPAHVVVRETVNDVELDRASWVFDHGRVVEHPPGAPAMLDARAVALGEAATTREVDGPGDIRLRSEPLSAPGAATPSGAVVVSLSVAPLERVEQEVLIGSLVIGVLIFLAGAIAISSALSGALRPVAEMTASAGDWGAHDLDRRFALGPPRDELTALAATLDGLLSRIAASRRHEQRFASEVAHELRTPLAGIIGRAELGLAAGGDAEALQSILAQANRLGAAIDTLLAVARQEIDGPAGEVDPVVIAREFEGVDVHVSGHIPNVEGDAELLRRALAPLVENA